MKFYRVQQGCDRRGARRCVSRVDEITVICYTPIAESDIEMLGPECYEVVRHDPELTWQERKTGQVHRRSEITQTNLVAAATER